MDFRRREADRILIQAKSFIWNQVRRIASAFAGIASGRISILDLESALNSPKVSVDLEGLLRGARSLGHISQGLRLSFLHELPISTTFSVRPSDPEVPEMAFTIKI